MNTLIQIEKNRKITKTCGWGATIIYLILFPFLLMFAAATTMVFDKPDMSIPYG